MNKMMISARFYVEAVGSVFLESSTAQADLNRS